MGANGKQCEHVGGSCSCCGAQDTTDKGGDWYVYRAGFCDTDGVFYPRLCGSVDGLGCISDVKPAPADHPRQVQADLLIEMMPDEIDDNVATEMED